MTYNIERLEALHENISREAALGKHDQGSWGKITSWLGEKFNWPSQSDGGSFVAVSCPTTACAAGWTVINEKARMLFNTNDLNAQGSATAGHCVLPNGEIKDIEMYAAELLGITDDDERNDLFSGGTETDYVLRSIQEIIVAAKHDRTWREQRRLQRSGALVGSRDEGEISDDEDDDY
jgi:hypothetical protein